MIDLEPGSREECKNAGNKSKSHNIYGNHTFEGYIDFLPTFCMNVWPPAYKGRINDKGVCKNSHTMDLESGSTEEWKKAGIRTNPAIFAEITPLWAILTSSQPFS